MSMQVVKPKIRGFVCTTSHPTGCARQVQIQADAARRPTAERAGGNMLVLGASTGYGLATRITGAMRHGMDTLGVFFERPATERRPASAGWYNTAAFHDLAEAEGLKAASINGDAFSNEIMQETIDRLKSDFAPLDLVVYSLAAPRRTDPETGEVYKSVLKTIGKPTEIQSINLNNGEIEKVGLEPASEQDIADTIAVMGGADLRRWVDALSREGLLADGARVVAYSYLGPEVTWPVYRHGTIGRAKADLEVTAATLNDKLQAAMGGNCYVCINKSIVTQASAAIPAVPLYMSLLFEIMKEQGTHEGPIEQMIRLFDQQLGPGKTVSTDPEGRIRLDDLEMDPKVQAEVMKRWDSVTSETVEAMGYARFRRYFLQLFGFEIPGVDYDEAVETEISLI